MQKINNVNTITELDNMSIAAIISTQLLHEMFIRKTYSVNTNKELSNLRIIEKPEKSMWIYLPIINIWQKIN